MKYNLKNRPKTCYKDEMCLGDADMEEWFEGFEAYWRTQLDQYRAAENDEAERLLKRILGDA
jgi:hypothetical protein